MKEDLEELLGKRVRIQVSEPYGFFGPWGGDYVYGHVASHYLSYGSMVLEVELDLEVDWEKGKGKRIIVVSRFTNERFPNGRYPSWQGTNLLSLLEGKEVIVNVHLPKEKLLTPSVHPDLVAFGGIRVIEEESWKKIESEMREDLLERYEGPPSRAGVRRAVYEEFGSLSFELLRGPVITMLAVGATVLAIVGLLLIRGLPTVFLWLIGIPLVILIWYAAFLGYGKRGPGL